jgi:ligand-binding SRPBCC domain-containing protein
MAVELDLTTQITAPIEAVFDLSLNIDAHAESMGRSREQAIAGVTSGQIGLGQSVTWRARHFGLPFTMTSRIVELDRPRWFVDEQTSGPFRTFRHEHRLSFADDVTTMRDLVHFEAPVGPLGRLAERAVLERYLESLIEDRNAHLKATAEARQR